MPLEGNGSHQIKQKIKVSVDANIDEAVAMHWWRALYLPNKEMSSMPPDLDFHLPQIPGNILATSLRQFTGLQSADQNHVDHHDYLGLASHYCTFSKLPTEQQTNGHGHPPLSQPIQCWWLLPAFIQHPSLTAFLFPIQTCTPPAAFPISPISQSSHTLLAEGVCPHDMLHTVDGSITSFHLFLRYCFKALPLPLLWLVPGSVPNLSLRPLSPGPTPDVSSLTHPALHRIMWPTPITRIHRRARACHGICGPSGPCIFLTCPRVRCVV